MRLCEGGQSSLGAHVILYVSLYSGSNTVIEPSHDKTNKMVGASNVDSNQPAQSDQGLHCPHEESLVP